MLYPENTRNNLWVSDFGLLNWFSDGKCNNSTLMNSNKSDTQNFLYRKSVATSLDGSPKFLAQSLGRSGKVEIGSVTKFDEVLAMP